MKKYNNFNDFGNHVKVEKEKKIKEALFRINQGIFVENLAHLNSDEIELIVPLNNKRHVDYIVENKKNILFKECILEKSVNLSQSLDTFVLIYTIEIPETGETIEIRPASSCIDSNGISVDVEFTIEDIYLKEFFIESNTICDYNDEDLSLIKLYNTLLNNTNTRSVDYVTKHVLRKNTKIIVSHVPKFYISYSLLIRERINAGFSKYFMRISDTSSNSFASKLRNLLETEYTLPMVSKKIDELTEDDITVIQMGLI